jgi:dienelactone hydrolase
VCFIRVTVVADNKLLAWIEPRHGEGECVAAFVSVYHGTVPLLVLSGEADDWVPPSNCLAFGKQLEAQPAVRDPHLFGVVHMFDAPSVNTLRMNEGHKMQYNYAAASDSYERVRAFLDKWVRGKLASE